MAAGFTVERDKLPDLRAFIAERTATRIKEAGIKPTLSLDGAIKPGAVSTDMIEQLEKVGPFGSGNPEPRFVLPSARIGFADVVGDAHVRLSVATDGTGRALKAISFRSVETELGQALLNSTGAPMHLAGRLRIDSWQGRRQPQLLIDDAARAW